MAEEKKVSILNLSKTGRRYDLMGGLKLLPNHAILVPAAEAEFLLSKLPNGRGRFPDLVDADKVSPEAAKVRAELITENENLRAENQALQKELEALKKDEAEPKKAGKGGSK